MYFSKEGHYWAADLPEKEKSLTLHEKWQQRSFGRIPKFSSLVHTISGHSQKKMNIMRCATKRALIIFWCREWLIGNYISCQARSKAPWAHCQCLYFHFGRKKTLQRNQRVCLKITLHNQRPTPQVSFWSEKDWKGACGSSRNFGVWMVCWRGVITILKTS